MIENAIGHLLTHIDINTKDKSNDITIS